MPLSPHPPNASYYPTTSLPLLSRLNQTVSFNQKLHLKHRKTQAINSKAAPCLGQPHDTQGSTSSHSADCNSAMIQSSLIQSQLFYSLPRGQIWSLRFAGFALSVLPSCLLFWEALPSPPPPQLLFMSRKSSQSKMRVGGMLSTSSSSSSHFFHNKHKWP